MSMKNKWVKCFKIDCTPAVEVFQDFVRVYGTNIDIKDLDRCIKEVETKAELWREVKQVWVREFKRRPARL